ncbi:MAG: hypothetical protein AAFN81_23715 [Bacteroidota bacterium]
MNTTSLPEKTPWIPIISAAVAFALVYFGVEYLQTIDGETLAEVTSPKTKIRWLARLPYTIKYALVFGLFAYLFGHRRAAIGAFSVVVVLQFVAAFVTGPIGIVIRQSGYWLPFITYAFLAFGRTGLLLGASMVCFQAVHLTSLPEMTTFREIWQTISHLLGLEQSEVVGTILTSLFYPYTTDPFGFFRILLVTGLAVMYFWCLTSLHRLSPQREKGWMMFRWIKLDFQNTKASATVQFLAQRWFLYALCFGAFQHLAFIHILSSTEVPTSGNAVRMYTNAIHRQLLCWGGLLIVAWWHRKFLIEYWFSRGQTPSFGYWLLQLPFVGLLIWAGQQLYFGALVPLQKRITHFAKRDEEVVRWLKNSFLGLYALVILWQFVGQQTNIVDTNFFVTMIAETVVVGILLGLFLNRSKALYSFVPFVIILTSLNIILLSPDSASRVIDRSLWLAGLGPCLLVVYYALFHFSTFYHTAVAEEE